MVYSILRVGAVLLLAAVATNPVLGNDDEDATIHVNDGVVSFGHDETCPECRAFLTSHDYSGITTHGPGCSCNAAGGGAGGGAGGAYGGDYDGLVGGDLAADYQELVASDYGAGRGYDSAAPGMIGDFFGGGYQMNIVSAGQPPGFYTNIPQAGGDRRFKIAENYSPFPIDRVFFNYNHFHGPLLTADGRVANLDRATFGVEKTFLDQWWSVEFRLPFSSGLNSDQTVFPAANNVSNEIGNAAVALKRLLWATETMAMSAGMGMVLPTGSDANVYDFSNFHVLTIHNDAIYLQPFVGLWYTPNDQFFAQFAVQADFDVVGNEVDFVQVGTGPEGTIQDQSLMFLDVSMGYWLFRDPYSDAIITGIAPMIELHHNTTLEDPDLVQVGPDTITNPHRRQDVLNLTGALRFELVGRSYLTVFGVAPLRDNEEKLFDSEFGVQYTRLY